MRQAVIAAALCGSLMLSGCVTVSAPRAGSELVGRSARLLPATGQASTLYFQPDGTVRSMFGRRQASGRWWVQRRRLCFLWAGNVRECWPYAAPLRPGQTRTITSDRGNVVRVTLL